VAFDWPGYPGIHPASFGYYKFISASRGGFHAG
jgi:hypothetical protein